MPPPGTKTGKKKMRRSLDFTLAIPLLGLLWAQAAWSQSTQPLVAVHDSELTRALESTPASPPTPIGAGTTGSQWWPTDWHYFVMPEAVKEALRSDGTAFTVVGDSNITAGLLLPNGLPKYPIVISLAAEAMRNDEIGPLTNYVAAGGFLVVGSSAFTRNPDGTSRGDFALANAMGLHVVTPGLQNWGTNNTLTKQMDHRLTRHIPAGPLTWRMPSSADEISWGISPAHIYLAPHDVWQVQASDATVLATGDNYPYLSLKQYGKGFFIYVSAMQPLIGHNGFAPGMYAYVIFRRAIEWAFESAQLPVPKLSPWPYQYDAAMLVRHDLENFQNEIAGVLASAQFEATNGAKGDYYFCTGTLRDEMTNSFNTNAVVAGLRQAVTNYGATIGPHNGGLKNPNNPSLALGDYDYWHWGPDEALDVTPPNFASGKAYALASVSNSFVDVERWLTGITNGVRAWAGCYFNATREDSFDIQAQLGVKIAGEQKLTPFPHWTLSTRTPGKRYPLLSEPASDWFVGGLVAQSLEPWHPPGVQTLQTLRDGVDFYYQLGGLLNFYCHTLATGVGDAGPLAPEYITYSLNTNLHPRVWSANALGIYQWWLQRSNAQVTVAYNPNGNQSIITVGISGSSHTNTAVEMVLPSLNYTNLLVFTNGALAGGGAYRVSGQALKLRVGTSVTNAEIRYTLAGGAFFSDDFTRTNDPAPLAPWVAQSGAWSITGGALRSGPNPVQSYGFSYLPYTWDNFSVEAQVQLPPAVFGGGVNGRLNPVTGAQYAAWIYPEGSTGGSSVVKLIKFQNFTTFGYTNVPGIPMQQASLPGVGTTYHTLKMALFGNRIAVYYDGVQMMSVTDVEPQPYLTGGAGASMWTDNTTYTMSIDNFVVKPLAVNDSFTVSGTSATTVPPPGVLSNDTAVFTTSLTAQQSSTTAHGTLTFNSNGGFTYTPSNNYVGPDSFTYQAFDGTNNLGTATVTLAVGSRHNGPSLPPQTSQTIAKLSTLTLNNAAIDSDFPFPVLSYNLLAGPTNATISGSGIITWTPAQGQAPSTNTLTTVVIDNGAPPLSATNTFSVVVNDINLPPALPVQANRIVPRLKLLVVTNAATDPDIPAEPLTYVLVNPPAGATIDTNGIITWTPSPAQEGTTNVITTVVTDFNPNAVNAQHLSATNSFTVIVDSQVAISLDSTALVVEGCAPANNAIDPGETVTVLFSLKNAGPGDTANLVATLLTTNGVVVPSAPQNYGALFAGGAAVTEPFTFAATGACGGTIIAVLQLQDGAINLGTVSATFPLGFSGNVLTQSFDTVVAPALPSGWTNAPATGAESPWVTQTAVSDTAPNAAFSPDPTGVGLNELDSPAFTVPNSQAQLSFRNNFNLEASSTVNTLAYDGGVLEIKIGTNAFTDILAAGGTFVTNGYTRTLSSSFGNPLGGRQAWSGNSGGFVTTIVNLPATALGKSVQFRWRCGTDNGGPVNPGWYIDSVSVNGNGCCQNNAPVLPVQVNRTNAELVTLVVTNTVIDTGIPASAISYALLVAPTNAVISTNGVITWTPAQFQSPGTNTFTTVATYNGAPPLSTTNTFIVVVTEVNVAPVLPAIPSQTVSELTLLTVTNTASESNVHATLGYTLINPPSGMSIDANGVITWTPGQNQSPGTNLITTVVTNTDAFDLANPHLNATNSFTVIVRELNVAPVLPVIPAQTVNEVTLLTVTNTAAEPNIHSSSAYNLINPPSGMSIDANGIITWTPSQSQSPGTNLITTVVTNTDVFDLANPHLNATNSFTVIVREVNVAPVLPVIPIQTVNELTLLTITNTASEPNTHATLGYTLINPPSGISINANGIITWTPSQSESPGTNLITTVVTNTDSYDAVNPHLSATNIIVVIVREVNVAPVLSVIPAQAVNELTLLTVTNTASEPNIHATLGYTLVNPPSGMNIDANGIITWTPSQNQSPGTNLITTVVTNSDPLDLVNPHLSAANSFTVIVREVNVAPVLPLIPAQTVNELTLLTVTNTATESNIHVTLGYTLMNPPSGMNIDTNGIITWTPSQGQSPGTNLITMVVTNTDPYDLVNPHLNATNSFTVVVQEVNVAPVLPVVPTQTVNELTLLTVTNTATESNIHATLGYTLVNPPSGMNIDTNGIVTWTPSQSQSPGTNLITTVVTNTDPYDLVNPHLNATNRFTVVVQEVNVAPVLPVIATQMVNELTLLTVTNTASESNIHASLGYTLVNPPSGMNIDGNGIVTWTPSQSQSPGTNLITTVVTNTDPYDLVNPHLSATNSFTVIVQEVNVAPVLPLIATQTVNELTLLTVTNTAAEANLHSSLAYTLMNPPSGASIDTNGVITWTPGEAQGPGTNTITTIVVNSNRWAVNAQQLSATNSFTVVVNEVNVPPVLPVQADRTLAGLQPLVVTNTATDSDIPANTLTYTLLTAPANALIDTNGIITWTPAVAQVPSTNLFTTVVTDYNPWAINAQHLSATNSFTVVVNPVHNGPDLPLSNNVFMVQVLQTLVATNTAIDTDVPLTTLNYQLTAAPTNAVIDTNGVITWTPSASQVLTTNEIRTRVTDSGAPPMWREKSFWVVVLPIHNGPALPVQTNRTIAAAGMLIVTNTASSSDMPLLPLTYTLAAGPTNASIDGNGVITWTPVPGQAPSTNIFKTVVMDNGTPPLSATNSFVVMVTAPLPVLQSVTLSNNVARITWSAAAGLHYRLQFKARLDDAAWHDLTPDITSPGTTATANDPVAGVTQRFYRVLLLP